MKINTEALKIQPTDIVTRTVHDTGTQIVVRFPNGFGASIINHSFSYGTEIGVISFESLDIFDFELTYSTPVTNDVLGWQSTEDVIEVLNQISALNHIGE